MSGIKPGAVVERLRLQQERDERAAEHREATGAPGPCAHVRTMHMSANRGGQLLHVKYCQGCGSLGPSSSTPTLGEWVPPENAR
jgi:hypothetical protein